MDLIKELDPWENLVWVIDEYSPHEKYLPCGFRYRDCEVTVYKTEDGYEAELEFDGTYREWWTGTRRSIEVIRAFVDAHIDEEMDGRGYYGSR